VCWPGGQVRLQVGMETTVPVQLGVAAKCAELLGMEVIGSAAVARDGQVASCGHRNVRSGAVGETAKLARAKRLASIRQHDAVSCAEDCASGGCTDRQAVSNHGQFESRLSL